MNQYIAQLARMGAAKKRTIIGLMSGTSLDGLDIALCEIGGSGMETEVVLKKFTTVSFEEAFKNSIRSIFSKKIVDFEQLCLLNPWVGEKHASIILATLKSWGIDPSEIDLIASHGQTVYHAPKILHGHPQFGNGTLQIGDGDHIAVKTGIITISDFRQKHIAAGGEGAPLAVYGDYFIFSKKGEDRIMLNIGGIANYTFLPGNLDASKIFSTDTGPGNTLMDQLAQKHFDLPYDKDAAIALKGTVNNALLTVLLKDAFFEK
ncbi:MAG: anhydro-N-acetylmuramic acid kinase, partial [Sphingobacteriia bacterium 32-37-4]